MLRKGGQCKLLTLNNIKIIIIIKSRSAANFLSPRRASWPTQPSDFSPGLSPISPSLVRVTICSAHVHTLPVVQTFNLEVSPFLVGISSDIFDLTLSLMTKGCLGQFLATAKGNLVFVCHHSRLALQLIRVHLLLNRLRILNGQGLFTFASYHSDACLSCYGSTNEIG